MDNKKITIGAAALTALIMSAGLAVSSFAYQGNPNVQGPNYTAERHEAIIGALDSGDYNAWSEARKDISKSHIGEVINEDNFDKFVEMHNLRLAGDIAGANKVRTELGLGQGSQNHGNRRGHGQKNGRGMQNASTRGQNNGGNFVDTNHDGICDNIQ